MNLAAMWRAIGCRGCLDGSAHILDAALNWTLQNNRSTGGKSAWASSMSYAVPRMPPVIYLTAVPQIDCRDLVSETDPHDIWECDCLNGGMYHMSGAYVKAGTAMVL